MYSGRYNFPVERETILETKKDKEKRENKDRNKMKEKEDHLPVPTRLYARKDREERDEGDIYIGGYKVSAKRKNILHERMTSLKEVGEEQKIVFHHAVQDKERNCTKRRSSKIQKNIYIIGYILTQCSGRKSL